LIQSCYDVCTFFPAVEGFIAVKGSTKRVQPLKSRGAYKLTMIWTFCADKNPDNHEQLWDKEWKSLATAAYAASE
jgi:hypothetical protein